MHSASSIHTTPSRHHLTFSRGANEILVADQRSCVSPAAFVEEKLRRLLGQKDSILIPLKVEAASDAEVDTLDSRFVRGSYRN